MGRSHQNSKNAKMVNSKEHKAWNIANVAELVKYTHDNSNGTIRIETDDFDYGATLEDTIAKVAKYDVLAGAEGAGFANSPFLPLGGGLLVIHGFKPGGPKDVLQW